MSPSASNEELSLAILQQVEHGAYPDSEDVASADIPSDALPALLDAVGKARDGVKGELRQLSRQSAPDIDGWITQAKQLQVDIERSKATAREIVQGAEAGKTLDAHVKDASSKVDLLRKELDFNVTLAGTLEQLQIISGLLDGAQNAASEGELSESLEKLGNALKVIDQLDSFENTRFAGLVQRRATQLRDILVGRVQEYWHGMVKFTPAERNITIHGELKGANDISMDLQQVVHAMSELHILDSHISRLHRDLDTGIVAPRFTPAADGAVAQLEFEGSTVRTSGRAEAPDSYSLLKDVKRLVEHLTNLLPQQALDLLLEKMLPALVTQVITGWLEPSVPVDPEHMGPFKNELVQIQEVAECVDSTGVSMPSDANLSDWIERLPQTWLARRREAALTSMRSFCHEGVKAKKSAERVETQKVSRDDVMVSGTQQEDDWDAGWDDEEAAEDDEVRAAEAPPAEEEDVDANAWGLEDEEEESSQESKPEGEEGEDDAWGAWGDEEAADEEKNTKSKQDMGPPPVPKPKANGSAPKQQGPPEREITLRETFTTTSIPDNVLELVHRILSDAEVLSGPDFPITSISTAAPALSSVPTLLLALYRATARTFYASDPAGDMLIYNDSQHLATSLQTLLSEMSPDHALAKRLQRSLEADTKLLTTFSRQAYGREMDSQRTILTDLLSSTSGFANCTRPLNTREYRNAIDDVAARLRQVNKVWKGVLSDSARLQSLGALLSHVIRGVVDDILELADEPIGISEEQSKVLKSFCDQIADLADLFIPEEPSADGERRTAVHVYTPLWLRFGYLGEILEASLADIKFLWTEGELSLELESSEVVTLIEALFAESQMRKDAIREIRGRR